MTAHFTNLILAILQTPEAKIAELTMISEAEKHQLIYEFNATCAEYLKDKTIQELFEARVAQNPDNIAVVYEDKKLTYQELNQKANQLAQVLRNKGVGPDHAVGLMTGRSLEC
jgi:tyrocidine synthetase-3